MKTVQKLALFILFVCMAPCLHAQTGWNLIFSDEFNGSGLDVSKWSVPLPYNAQCGPNEDEVYQSGAVSEGGGTLTITATNNGSTGTGGSPCPGPWESGAIQTYNNSIAPTYGYFEMRAKIASGPGFWPAFWLKSAVGNVADYPDPEIDIMEMLNTATTTVYQTYHAAGTSGQGDQYAATSSIDCSMNFCDFAVDWEPGTLTYYLNGVATYTYTGSDVSSTAMYIVANLAVGGSGSWPGSWNGSTPSPAYMQIDYVRAYQHPSTGSGCYSMIPGPTSIPSATCGVGPSYTSPEIQDEQDSSTIVTAPQTMDAAVTSGDFLVGMARDGNNNCPPDTISISDNGSPMASWKNALTYNDTVNGTCLIMGWAANVTASPTVITGTFTSSGAQNDVNIAEFSLSTSEKVDVVGAGTTNGPASSATTSTVTTTQSSDLLIACLGTAGARAVGITVSAGTGSATWHLFYYQAQRGVCAWATTSSVGTYSAQFSWTGGALPSETIIAAFTATSTFSFDLSSLPEPTYANAPFSVAGSPYVTTNSSGAVTFALGTGSVGCSVTSGGMVTITGVAVGSQHCVIAASLAPSGNYSGAGPLSQQFNIAPATPTISISNLPASGVYGGGFTATYSYSGNGTLTESVISNSPTICTASGSVVSYVGAGTCSLSASATATTDFTSATGSPQSFMIAKATPTISISNLPASGVYGGGFTATYSYTGND